MSVVAAKLINQSVGTDHYYGIDELIEQMMYLQTFEQPSSWTWTDVRSVVRKGISRFIFPVGYKFSITHDSVATDFEVVGHDAIKNNDDESLHTMTLLSDKVFKFGALQFLQNEAFATNTAGTGTYRLSFGGGSYYYFTITGSHPATAKYVFKFTSMAKPNMTDNQVDVVDSTTGSVYATYNIVSTAPGGDITQTIPIAEDTAKRCLRGNPVYSQSPLRRYLTNEANDSIPSDARKNEIFSNEYMKDSYVLGFPEELRNVICKGKYGDLTDKIIIPSMAEVGLASGRAFDKYKAVSNADRIKQGTVGATTTARKWALRDTNYSTGFSGVDADGTLYNDTSNQALYPIMFTIS